MNLMRIMVLGVLLSGGLAAGGMKDDRNVFINTQLRAAYASMGAARNSSDFTQYLVCQIVATTSGISGTCEAQNTQGTLVACQTTNQYLLEVLKSINDTSFVGFSWDVNGECNQIYVGHGSPYGPKQ
ncbi:hypothetical protein HUW62_39745 [Myxococcus sp. AM011]|uniref:hypothetical protein n=1 Tax=Myxococcus sp. AM011 TaxID=2745200 RepID=UPI001595D3DE|nr:hypothetical protein [Myxococcus sp. AM011]NVJ27367.1 hypothetical protein [Myxococcus sp. AM011]